MSDDFERRLRDDLTHRADAVTPESTDWDDLTRRMSRRNRRTRTWLTVGLVVALVAGPVAGFGIARAVQDDDVANRVVASGSRSSQASGTPSGTGMASSSAVVPPDGRFPGVRLESIFRRTTDDGVTIRAFTTPSRAPCPDGASCPPPDCFPDAGLVGQLSTEEAIGFAYTSHYADTTERIRFTGSGVFGANGEGSPARWVAAQTGQGVDEVRVAFEGGGSDQMAPVDGTVLLAARADTGKTGGTIEALDGSGSVVQRLDLTAQPTTFAQAGPPVILLSPNIGEGSPPAGGTTATKVAPTPSLPAPIPNPCMPPPPALPAAGEQPADPAAARTAITDAYAKAYQGGAAELVQDYAALEPAMEQSTKRFPQQATSATAVASEIVFTSPTEAAVRYDIKIQGSTSFGNRIGKAVFVDGRWKVARETICADLSLAGVTCPSG